jgi:hypothetical protein
MHKKQSFEVPVKRSPPKPVAGQATAAAAAPPSLKPASAPPRRNPLPMKLFFVLVSLGLMLSTLTGICMGWRYSRHRRRYGATLAAGVLVPALLLLA